MEGVRARGPVPHRVRGQPRSADHVRHHGSLDLLRRAQSRVDHRRVPARGGRRRRVPASSTSTTCARSCARPRRPARARGERHRVLDGRRHRRRRRAGRTVRAGARAARARRGSRRARPNGRGRARRRRAPGRHVLEDARRARRFRRRSSRRYVELVENSARPYIFTTAPTPADTAAALAALRVVRSPEGEALIARLRANVDRLRPGHPSPILPFMCGEEQRESRPRRPCSSTASSCPRSGRRPSRPGRHGCGSH